MKTNYSIFIKRVVRLAANAKNNVNVKIIEGFSEPKIVGEQAHYVNYLNEKIFKLKYCEIKGGRKMKYIRSTLRVEVGANWLLDNDKFNHKNCIKLNSSKPKL